MMRPRDHLSWTQLNTLESSEKQYKKIYLEGFSLKNRGINLGSIIADALCSGEETGDAMNDLIVACLPKFELMDNTFEATIDVGGVKIPLLSKIDSARKDLTAIKEYKTGTGRWTQKMVDACGQITFYCVVAQAITGKIPQDIELVYAPTIWTPAGEVELTGEIIRFKTKRTIADCLQMKIRQKKAWQRIGEIVEEELI